jgi:hypothetical protein
MRQLGALLLLAQERSREGRTETRPGEGRWWTTVPRWGGGAGGEVGNTGGNSDERLIAAEGLEKERAAGSRDTQRRLRQGTSQMEQVALNTKKRERGGGESGSSGSSGGGGGKTRTRRESAAEAYKRLEPGRPIWDSKVEYRRIGKRKRGGDEADGADEPDDDVWLVSAINHHVSLVRMSVGKGYLSWMETGTLTEGIGRIRGPEVLQTRWFDLFSPADRIELMRGIWGVFSWQMRDVSGE